MPQTTPYSSKFNPSTYSSSHSHRQPVEENYGGLHYRDNKLVSGSLEALIQLLVPTVDYYPDRSYIFTFLLSSRLFLHPFELMSRVCYLCVDHHRVGDPQTDKKRIREMAPKIVQLLTEWTETFPYDFRDERMMRSLKEMTHRLAFGDELSRRAMQRLIQRLLRKLTTLGQYEESLATSSATAAAMDRPLALKSKQQLVRRDDCVLNLCDDPFVFAQQLTHIEMERLGYIGPEEFVRAFAQKRPSDNHKSFFSKRKASNLEAYIEWFNRLSYLIATEICMPVKKKHRARVLEFFIDVAQECFNIGNFNSLMAIITGMNMNPVSRLKKTWNKVNTDKFDILVIVIPFFSLFIKDIYFLNEGCVNRLPNGHINFEKFWELAKQVSEFLSWRQVVCPFERDRKTLQYLISAPVFSEDELQLASYESEGPENNLERDTRRSLSK
ncbi:ras-GEF domain-containing family member 1B-B-like protein [Labeo rohita]|uniref:Ras-GEF domain-containing family member 1B-B-like protein n=1 Tax=Labeo rohita TaxID=84645 RepID=A0A498MPT8_LABRO|nr:ras-GEF domain-containing family member 1B-B-like protein [Labeo rohita]